MSRKLFSIGLMVVMALFTVLAFGFARAAAREATVAHGPSLSAAERPSVSFHFWQVNEIFSCPDGSIQFVEMTTTSDGQQFLSGHELRTTNSDTSEIHGFFFPSNSGDPTANHSLLIATAGFGALAGGVTPDFILPANFIFTDGSAGSVQLVGAATPTLTYSTGQLPLDGVTSLGQSGATGVNSPTNFAGQTGSVTCPVTLSIDKQASASSVQAGGAITYTLTVTGSGALSNTNTVLTDTLPLSTTFVSASDTFSQAGSLLTWTLGDLLSPLTVVTRTLVVSVEAATGAVITNSNYGVSSDQTSASGLAVAVSVGDNGGGPTLIYLPVILKNFPSMIGEHDGDLPALLTE